jgi:branched-chain amino acid aminotransferase
MADRDGLIWFDGQLVPWREAKVHALAYSLHYGMGAFEGIRAYQTDQGPAIFRLAEHTDRLFNSTHILGMQIPFSKAEINEAVQAVVKQNNLASAYIRPLCFYGCGTDMGLRAKQLQTHLTIAAWAWPSYMGEEATANGIKVRTSSYTRHHVNITLCKAKAIANYTNSILALKEANDSGCEEALLLDNEGYVTEGSGENIFLVTQGELHTPELTSCLDGITRNCVFHFAEELNLKVKERRITRDEIYIAEEAFFTGTAAEIVPIQSLDGRVIGNGQRGPVTQHIQQLYFDQVRGRRQQYPEWLTLVD